MILSSYCCIVLIVTIVAILNNLNTVWYCSIVLYCTICHNKKKLFCVILLYIAQCVTILLMILFDILFDGVRIVYCCLQIQHKEHEFGEHKNQSNRNPLTLSALRNLAVSDCWLPCFENNCIPPAPFIRNICLMPPPASC